MKVRPLQDDLSFGARISGVTLEALEDEAFRAQIRDIFEDSGMIVFEEVEPTGQMHVALSNVFGPLKDHPVPTVDRVDQDVMPGVIDMRHDPNNPTLVQVDGQVVAQWLPWHFDHCYNDELNRAGVLRAIDIPAEGGRTGFADGIDLYKAFSPELRARIENSDIIYRLNVVYDEWRFGKPEGFQSVRSTQASRDMNVYAKTLSRALHPAVWARKDGRKVLHVSPWMAEGIAGQENEAGDALLEAVCQEISAKVQPYFHQWNKTDMLIWDNWRMLHCVGGTPQHLHRRMQRTTIKGDYGLGRFENEGKGDAVLTNTMV